MSILFAASSAWKGWWQITLFNCISDSFAVKLSPLTLKHFVIFFVLLFFCVFCVFFFFFFFFFLGGGGGVGGRG